MPREGSETVLQYSAARRLTLAAEGARVEVRGAQRSWIASHVIPYSQIRAVYQYEMRDWGFVVVLSVIWLAAVGVVGVAGILLQDPGYLSLIASAIVTVGLGALGTGRLMTAPKRHLRIDIVGQAPMILPNRSPGFFDQLASRLPKSDDAGAGAASQVPDSAGDADA